MTFISEVTTRGITRTLTLDGVDVSVFPSRLLVTPTERIAVNESLAGDLIAVLHSLDQEPDRIEKYRIEFPFDGIEGASKSTLQRQAMKGGSHSLAIWIRETAWYTATAGQIQFLLPQKRRNAGQALAGLVYSGITVSDATCPFKVWIDAAAQTIITAAGPTVTRPASGSVTIARDPIASGKQEGFVEFRVGADLAGGELIEIEYTALLVGRLTRSRIEFPESVDEGHTYVFEEG